MTKEHKNKISYRLKGKNKSKEHRFNMSISAKKRNEKSENNPNYRGDEVGYVGIHIWLRKHFELAKECSKCGKIGKYKNNKWTINWCLRNGFKYQRAKRNFIELCNSCHRNYDKTLKWNNNISQAKVNK